MRKYVVFILTAAMFLASCSGGEGKTAPPFLSKNYMFTADFTMNEIEGSLQFKKNGIEDCELTFLSPDNLAGLKLIKAGGIVTMEYKGMSYDIDMPDLMRDNPIKALYELLSETNTPASVTADKTTGNVKYLYENGSYIITYSDVPKSIEVPTAGISLKITGFEIEKGADGARS